MKRGSGRKPRVLRPSAFLARYLRAGAGAKGWPVRRAPTGALVGFFRGTEGCPTGFTISGGPDGPMEWSIEALCAHVVRHSMGLLP